MSSKYIVTKFVKFKRHILSKRKKSKNVLEWGKAVIKMAVGNFIGLASFSHVILILSAAYFALSC